jgi:tetratricopeptide (TPR) repeat protein
MGREAQIAHLDRAIELAPTRAYYYETRAIYHIDLRQFDRARAISIATSSWWTGPYARYLRGLVLCQSGDPRAALADFDAAIAGQPANTQFYRGRSLARAATGDVTGAMADAEHLVATVPQQGESYYARGVARALAGNDRGAIEDFDRAAAYPARSWCTWSRHAPEPYESAGDAAGAARDRDAVAKLRSEHASCGFCSDPFRY